ncbi:hypothetical protein PMKS-003553 [Pichia membranifaciens]|uniref:Uncharacterized protein n=1 Tax=Pichia membranifaciens TaxID=4926 RepID=A0A1Q2YKH5_9ASCO|nr:hypothetical protein PMKS-003553 [Pichia membranifaciens]
MIGPDKRNGLGPGPNKAENSTDTCGHEDGPWGGYLGVGALLGNVERDVKSGHGPDDSKEGHQHTDSVWPVGEVVDSPCLSVVVELRETEVCSVVACQDDDPGDEQEDHVQDGGAGVDACDPSCWTRGDASTGEGDGDGEQVGVPSFVFVSWVGHGFQGQNDACAGPADGRTTCQLNKVV